MADRKLNKEIGGDPDDFWDISDLVIPLKKKAPSATRSFDTTTAEITLPNPSGQPTKMREDGVIAAPKDAPIPTHSPKREPSIAVTEVQPREYTPSHPLIEKVTLQPWKNPFPYYERFCGVARELFSQKGEPCAPVSFFSYMPQYDQMSRSQLAWYLYWRDQVRAGIYPKVEHSYIFLLIFEIINLPDLIKPERGLSMLCNIWLQYRSDYSLLDRYLSEWVCDYCLLHQLLPPTQLLGDAMQQMTEGAQLREFFVQNHDFSRESDSFVYLDCCSNYDYRKSRVYAASKEHAAMFDRHIPAALSAVLRVIASSDSISEQTSMQTTTVTRDTFVGALCSHRVKYKINVRYRSFSRSHVLRFLITDIVKYSENKLRAALGYKSKLSIYALSDSVKAILNAYFAEVFGLKPARASQASARPEYEKLYDLPDVPMSSEQAAKIEQESWGTTMRLVEAFEEATAEKELVMPTPKMRAEPTVTSAPQEKEPVKQATVNEPTPRAAVCREKGDFDDEQLIFLRHAYQADGSAQREFCRSIGKMPENLADAINEKSFDMFGDILLEEDVNGTFCVLEDYREEVSRLLGDDRND